MRCAEADSTVRYVTAASCNHLLITSDTVTNLCNFPSIVSAVNLLEFLLGRGA